jgi:hypothetical protein
MDASQLQNTSGMVPAGYIYNPPNPFYGMLPSSLLPLQKQDFTYSAIFAALTGASTQTVTIQINNDSHFATILQVATIWDSTGYSTSTVPTGAPMLVQIIDTASGSNTMDQPQPLGNVFGTGLQPFLKAMARIYAAGTSLSVTLQNLHPSNTYVVRLSFVGFKIYKYVARDDFANA